MNIHLSEDLCNHLIVEELHKKDLTGDGLAKCAKIHQGAHLRVCSSPQPGPMTGIPLYMFLQAGSDRAQQGGLLKQCLACWNVGSAQNEAVVQDSAVQDTVEMLVGFVAQSEGPSAADIVDIAQVKASAIHQTPPSACLKTTSKGIGSGPVPEDRSPKFCI